MLRFVQESHNECSLDNSRKEVRPSQGHYSLPNAQLKVLEKVNNGRGERARAREKREGKWKRDEGDKLQYVEYDSLPSP
jgi:hypothetical protein